MKQITVITRVYNHPEYLKIALDSILNQTLSKDIFDILIIDDGSDDTIQQILKDYISVAKIIRTKHIGTNNAAIVGFKATKTKYLILLDSDDYYFPTLLEELYEETMKSGSDYASCDYIEVDERNRDIKYMSLEGNVFITGANVILMKTDVVKKLGYYDKDLILPEYKLLYDLDKDYSYSYIQKALTIHRRYHGSVTSDKEKIAKGMEQLKPIFGDELHKIREY